MGVDPMGDCICRLPGETVTAHCDLCDPTHTKFTWWNNGACISCVRRARDDKKAKNALRHAEVLASKPNPVEIEEADYVAPVDAGNRYIQPEAPANVLEIVLRVNGIDLSITKDIKQIERMLRVK
jgi:hypothetical protein